MTEPQIIIPEQPVRRLGDDEGDGVRAPGDERAGGAVRHVAEVGDGAQDRLARSRGDLGGAVDHP